MKQEDKEFLKQILSSLIDSKDKAAHVFEMLAYENSKQISSDLFEVLFKAQNEWNDNYWLKQD